MSKKTFLFMTCLAMMSISSMSAMAQNTFSKDDTSFTTQMNNIFAPLDKTKVPFGILRDYAMEYTNIDAYNGTVLVDSTKTTYATVMDIYNTLMAGAISTSAGTFPYPGAYDSLWQIQRQAGAITLAGLFFQYASFLSNAVSSNLITITGNQLYDKYVGGVWQNPYQSSKVFAVSPSVNTYNTYGTYALSVILPANLWQTNSSSLVSGLTVDFADGAGFRTLANSAINISYTTGGKKPGPSSSR